MRYITNFFAFWRHFIIGDDMLIAATIMWTMLFVWSLSHYLFNAWIILPLIAISLLSVSVYNAVTSRQDSSPRTRKRQFMLSVSIPTSGVLCVPPLLFYLTNATLGQGVLIVLLGLYIAGASLVTAIAMGIYGRFPSLSIFLAGAASLVIIAWYDRSIIGLAQMFTARYPVVAVVGAAIVIIAFLLFCVSAFRRPKS